MEMTPMSRIEIVLSLMIEELRGIRAAVEALNTITPGENGTQTELPYEVEVEDPQ